MSHIFLDLFETESEEIVQNSWLWFQVIWDAFIADIQTKDSGKKKSKKRAARDFKAEVMKKMKVGILNPLKMENYLKNSLITG